MVAVMRVVAAGIVLAWMSTPALAAPPAPTAACSTCDEPILPPAQPWKGTSRKLVAPADDPWRTPCEASGFTRTPRYDETIAWLRRLCDATPDLHLVEFGKSVEGRALWMVVAARGARAADPASVRALGRPLVFVQAGIHAGEIDGKDAGLMLLRDLLRGRRLDGLLDRTSLVFVPIFNVDGHERFSAFTRINQRGPAEAGWRTTARNLNLNRDYTKVDAVEMRAMIGALVAWEPDLYVDLHVTDGADFRYDITWGGNGAGGWSPACRAWIDGTLTPRARAALERAGHVPGPFLGPVKDDDYSLGFENPTAPLRFSNGYGDARHLPALLVENHSLKPYEQRVLGTYVLLESILKTAGDDAPALRQALARDRDRRDPEVVLDWRKRSQPPYRRIDYQGIAQRQVPSAVSGAARTEWLGKPEVLQVPLVDDDEPVARVRRPRAYWIPPAWSDVAERLAWHGIRTEPQSEPRRLRVEMLRIVAAAFDSVPFEGRVRVKPRVEAVSLDATFAAGSVRVPTDQPLGDLAILLLEPEAPDSFFQWGFFHTALQRTEYAEAYIMEPMAQRMLDSIPGLRAEFDKRLRDDPAFAANPTARLDWFYRRTPFYDDEANLYPVARE